MIDTIIAADLSSINGVIPIIFVVFTVVFGIASSLSKYSKLKKAKTRKDSTEEVPPQQPERVKTLDEEFEESHKKRNSQVKYTDNEYAHRKSVVSYDDTDDVVIKEKLAKEQPKTPQHNHPKAQPSAGKKVVKEIKPKPAGSLGKLSDEGCAEHGDIRYVLQEVDTADNDIDAETAELQRLIVWSEILNKPKYKR